MVTVITIVLRSAGPIKHLLCCEVDTASFALQNVKFLVPYLSLAGGFFVSYLSGGAYSCAGETANTGVSLHFIRRRNVSVEASPYKLYCVCSIGFTCPYAAAAPDTEIRFHCKPLFALDTVFIAQLLNDRGFGISVYQKLKDGIPRSMYPICLSLYGNAPGDRKHAGSNYLFISSVINFHRTKPAVSVKGEPFVVAESRDVDAVCLGSVQYSCPFFHFQRYSVYGYLNHDRSPL